MKSTTEQDLAAGGLDYRKVALEDNKIVTASIEIINPKNGYNQWAYIRFKHDGKTVKRYVGKVTADSRSESLTLAWRLARSRQVIENSNWSWLAKSSPKVK